MKALEDIQGLCEASEERLASLNGCFWEQKKTGAYYTPTDACDFFWNQFFSLKGIDTGKKLDAFIAGTEFVEPAVGAGMFLFSLLKKILREGCSIDSLNELHVVAYDINPAALSFVKAQINKLEKAHNVSLGAWKFHKADYLKASMGPSNRKRAFIGNPPFVRNAPGSKWKNSFADFFEKSYASKAENIDVAFIIPLSFNFSRDYATLRQGVIRDRSSLFSVNFDNMPDCIFKSGKINSPNTNKANSQRCSIVYAFKDGQGKIFSTPLIRWSASERQKVFSEPVDYYDCSGILLGNQIPRPASLEAVQYAKEPAYQYKFSDLLSNAGKAHLSVATVARNYISFRDNGAQNSHQLTFKGQQELLIGFTILASNVFYDYWRSFGDGFHLTKTDVYNFPISKNLYEWATQYSRAVASRIWSQRSKFKKMKMNAGLLTQSYDFSGALNFSVSKFKATKTGT